MAETPRLFISYSWTTPQHEQWVLALATELRESGVDVVIDKWDLREGNDAVAFMEKMVVDPTITKVLLVCDKGYAQKTDGRMGGVGTEAQIISPAVYARQDQNKFVAVVAEKDDAGAPYLPTYYKSRIYIDLSESDEYSSNFEQLLRWIFDKPLNVKPEIGTPPSFISDANAPVSGTSSIAVRVVDGIKNGKSFVKGALEEFFTTFAENLERFRIPQTGTYDDEVIIKSIENFVPARNDFIQVITALSQYGDPAEHITSIHRFFEALIPYQFSPVDGHQSFETDSDNFRFLIHELFLYAIAILLKTENFSAATTLLQQPYVFHDGSRTGYGTSVDFTIFRQYAKSFEIRNQRMALRRTSLRVDLLEQRSKISGLLFRYIMQADFVCWMRCELAPENHFDRWWPETLLYSGRQHSPFEIFARSISSKYLSSVLPVLGIANISSLKAKVEEYKARPDQLPGWGFHKLPVATLLGIAQLATRP